MKPDLHPEYNVCKATCVCGNSFETKSTQTELRVSICSQCHPFFTGKEKLVDTAGRIDRFNRRYAKSKAGATS